MPSTVNRSPSTLPYYLPAILWSAAILLTSNDLFSAQHTGSLLARWLSPDVVGVVNLVVRKLAHFIGYGILGALSFRALRGPRAGWSAGWAVGAMGWAMAVAALDEAQQAFVPSRGGAVQDVVLDLLGAATAQVIIRSLRAARRA